MMMMISQDDSNGLEDEPARFAGRNEGGKANPKAGTVVPESFQGYPPAPVYESYYKHLVSF